MEKLSENFEKYISMTLLLLSGVLVIFQTVELLWMTAERMYTRATTALGLDPTPEAYTLKLRIILLVCLIAVSRKVFLLDIEHNAMLEFSTAALILAISAGYYLISRTETFNKLDHNEEEA